MVYKTIAVIISTIIIVIQSQVKINTDDNS